MKGNPISQAGRVVVEEDFEAQFIFGDFGASDDTTSLGTQTSVKKNSCRSREQRCGGNLENLLVLAENLKQLLNLLKIRDWDNLQ